MPVPEGGGGNGGSGGGNGGGSGSGSGSSSGSTVNNESTLTEILQEIDMAFGNQGIFPTSVYGQLSDTYGLPTYTTNNGFPTSSTGLVLGQGWLLFDFTIVQLLKSAVGTIAANAACTPQGGNGNIYTVQSALSTTTAGQVPVVAINDRGGALTTVGGINWMTTSGLATALVAASLPASSATNGSPLVSSATTTGQLTATAGAASSYYNNVILLNATTVVGAYPVQIF
jgi:hypothetical protein